MPLDRVILPPIPPKRYFAIGEVAELCVVKPHVLRYWEQEFSQLKPMKRRGNRRYYQHHEVLMIRRIRELLYDQGFTIIGARNFLANQSSPASAVALAYPDNETEPLMDVQLHEDLPVDSLDWLRQELTAIRMILNAKV